MFIFSYPPFESLGEHLAQALSCTVGNFQKTHFSNQELHLTVQENVAHQICILIGSISPPDSNLWDILALVHTLKKENADKISLILPYLAYSRQEKEEPQQSQLCALVADLLEKAGVDEILTFDIHSPGSKALFPIPLYSLSTEELFAQKLKQLAWDDAQILSPDQGAIERCERLSKQLNNFPIARMKKTRTSQGITQISLDGTLKNRIVILDDILDTGQTLVVCCKTLVEKGIQEILIMVTHGLFTGTTWQKLPELAVKKVYCTDTFPIKKEVLALPWIEVLPTQDLLIKFLKKF